jgi:uncharacterized protein
MLDKQLPVLPKATATWLIENTGLTFKQIADFCGLHELEIKGMADGEVSRGIQSIDPIATGQLSKLEIERCTKDPKAVLTLSTSAFYNLSKKKQTNSKYTPIARRQDKPDAICWLLKHYPNVTDVQIIKLIGTTKTTIAAIRNRSHWNMKLLRPRDPVLLGLCSQIELDKMVEKSEK